MKLLDQLAQEPRTLIFYESPKRILTLINEIIDIMGDRFGVLAREMTKLHEEFIRDQLSEILAILKRRSAIKGECTLLVSGWDDNRAVEWESVENEIKEEMQSSTEPVSKLVKRISQKYGLPKNKVYQEALDVRRQRSENRGQKTENR
ncbi:MAG: hypothetical protein JRD84_13460 [Deltaproteobacteria bacterium]|nr:hypothetical protein [Deltaproteobacteria bacterium]